MSELKCTHSCSDCSRLGCRSASEEQYPPFCLTTNVDKALLEETLEIYRNDPEQGLIARTSACIEGEFYGRLTRVEETIEFIKRMGYKKIGIASCVGLMRETSIFARILKAKGIEYFTVGCKVGCTGQDRDRRAEREKAQRWLRTRVHVQPDHAGQDACRARLRFQHRDWSVRRT